MGMTIEKMYGSYSDADLNDWERFPMNANVLTASAFGAWLLRRDERRDKAILKADYETRLKADMLAMLEEIDLEMSEQSFGIQTEPWEVVEKLRKKIIQQKINALKAEKGEEDDK